MGRLTVRWLAAPWPPAMLQPDPLWTDGNLDRERNLPPLGTVLEPRVPVGRMTSPYGGWKRR